MTNPTPVSSVRPPWHLWVVGGLTLLWNAGGALDFLMTQTRNEAYLAEFTPEQRDYFFSFPPWAVVTWGIATWGSLLGSLLVLLRKALAVPVLLAAFIGLVLTTVQNFVLSDGLELMGGGVGTIIFSGAIWVIAALLLLYARTQRRRGILR